MDTQNLYNFIADYAKESNVKLGDLAKQCGISRATLYRYMMGTNPIPESIITRMANILKMNDEDTTSFKAQLISIKEVNQTLIPTRPLIDTFFFGKTLDNAFSISSTAFAIYSPENSLFATNISDLSQKILTISNVNDKEETSCEIKIINCTDSFFANQVQYLFSAMKKSFGNKLNIEHLVSFPNSNYQECAMIFINILGLMTEECYKVFYSETAARKEYLYPPILNNIVLLTINTADKKSRSFVISFQNIEYTRSDVSYCMTADKELYPFTFFDSHYEICKKFFSSSQILIGSLSALTNVLTDFKKNNDTYLFKKDTCYHLIPPKVYKRIFKRIDQEAKIKFIKGYFEETTETVSEANPSSADIDIALNHFMEEYLAQYKSLSSHKYTAIHCKPGLDRFAEMRETNDPNSMLSMLDFDAEDRRDIFLYFKELHEDRNNNKNIIISYKEILQNGYLIYAIKNSGLIFTQSSSKRTLLLKNNLLADVFIDYANNYFCKEHAMGNDEVTHYLDDKIEMLKQKITESSNSSSPQ